MTRTLNLKRETLTELSANDLANIAGAQALSGLSCPVRDCLDMLTTRCASLPYCWE